SHCIFAPAFQAAVKRLKGAPHLGQGAANRLPHRSCPVDSAQGPIACRTGFDPTTLIVYTELAAVDVTEVDLDPCKLSGKPLQTAIRFVSDELDHPSIYQNVFVAVDLNPHAFLCSPPTTGGSKISGRLDSTPAWMIPFIG